MIYFLRGKVALVNEDSIVLDVRDVGYEMLVSHIDEYQLDEEVFVYTYNVVREDDNYLVGFKTLEEKNVFLSFDLINSLTFLELLELSKSPVLLHDEAVF